MTKPDSFVSDDFWPNYHAMRIRYLLNLGWDCDVAQEFASRERDLRMAIEDTCGYGHGVFAVIRRPDFHGEVAEALYLRILSENPFDTRSD